jgi:hypothetical protein
MDQREFVDYINSNYYTEPLENVYREKQTSKGTIKSEMYWNSSRTLPEVGDEVIIAGCELTPTEMGIVVKKSKAKKRPYYDVQITKSIYKKKIGKIEGDRAAYFLRILKIKK